MVWQGKRVQGPICPVHGGAVGQEEPFCTPSGSWRPSGSHRPAPPLVTGWRPGILGSEGRCSSSIPSKGAWLGPASP